MTRRQLAGQLTDRTRSHETRRLRDPAPNPSNRPPAEPDPTLGLALASIAVWFATALAASYTAHSNGLLMALLAVTISAWYGGVGPGLLATLLTLLSVDYVVPLLRSAEAAPMDGLRPSLFASVGILVSALSEARRHAEDDLQRSLETLERRVHEQTEELTAANTALSGQMIEQGRRAPDRTVAHGDPEAADRRAGGAARAGPPGGRDGRPAARGASPPLMMEIREPNAARPRSRSASDKSALGVPVGIHGVARDLTERERLESELRQAQKLEAIGHLAGGVAHDFNNILMVIQGYSEMLLSQVEDPEHRDDLQQIQDAARRGSDLTRSCWPSAASRCCACGRWISTRSCSRPVEMLTRLIGENISLRINPDLMVCPIEADRSQLEQVLMNLAVNARDAMTRGGSLTVSVDRVEVTGSGHAIPEGWYVKLEVSDTGSGMDDATKQRVFEPSSTTKAPGKGSGLGLSTVYGVVKQLGGDVTVESTPLQGSTFTVLLPVTTKVPETVHDTVIPELASGGGETVLLVEGDAPVRALLCSVLKRHGYDVLVANGPKEALSIAARHIGLLNLVLSEVIMPEMSGPEMVALLKNIRPEPAVLFLSGCATDALVTERVLPDSVSFVQKPVSARQLLQAVRQVLTPSDAPAMRAAS